MGDQGLDQIRNSLILVRDLREVAMLECLSLLSEGLLEAEVALDFFEGAVADAEGAKTLVNFLIVVREVFRTEVNFSDDAHGASPARVLSVDQGHGLPGCGVDDGRRDVEHDRVLLLNVLRVDVLDEGAKIVLVGKSWQVHQGQVEKVAFVYPQVDRLRRDSAANLCHFLLLGADRIADLAQLDRAAFMGHIFVADPDLRALRPLRVPDLHLKRALSHHADALG